MGRIIVSENVTLDGMTQDTAGDIGWFDEIMATIGRDEWAKVLFDEALGAEALLLGRHTDEWFAARWAARSGAWADRLNGMPKYVVSSTVEQAAWSNSTVLRGDMLDEVAKLKRELAGEIVVYASCQLVPALLAGDLVDEVRLLVFPVVLGAGRPLFGELTGQRRLRLIGAGTVGDGIASLSYEPLSSSPAS
jgi:dihydrofolate reductase